MITRKHRFHGHSSLNPVYKRGQTARAAQITLKYVQQNNSKPYRFAVVVSRKVSKSAVVRNRIRRRIYEIVRTHDVLLLNGLAGIFTAFHDSLATMPASELEHVVLQLLRATHPKNEKTAASGDGHGIVKAEGK